MRPTRLPGGLDRHLGRRFPSARGLLEGAIDDAFDFGDVERLADVVERAGADRLDGGLERAESADQHDRPALFGAEAAQQIETRAGRIQVDVRHQQVERIAADAGQRLVGILKRDELSIGRFQQLLEEPAGLRVVVDQKNARH